ncbi:MAG: translation initiation factor eIF-2B [Candidatus Aenigmarchaeota archaeon]|nr:translation initiation factor eIF-2B [Candidatus Aenigmarchaeota archaeon]
MNDTEIEKTIKDIKNLKIQGATAIAVAGIEILKEIHKNYGFNEKFNNMCERLNTTRPTAVPLHNVIEILKTSKDKQAFDKLILFLKTAKVNIATHTQKYITDGSTIMTHCHSSEVIESFKMAKNNGINFSVIVTETRPKLQGKQTAKDLLNAKIPVTYIVDSASSNFLAETTAVIMGIDAVRKEGVYNKIGSYMIALAAKQKGIPVYFLGNTLKIDKRQEITIEERAGCEVIDLRTLKGAKIKNPAFDLTPWNLITALITERGKY